MKRLTLVHGSPFSGKSTFLRGITSSNDKSKLVIEQKLLLDRKSHGAAVANAFYQEQNDQVERYLYIFDRSDADIDIITDCTDIQSMLISQLVDLEGRFDEFDYDEYLGDCLDYKLYLNSVFNFDIEFRLIECSLGELEKRYYRIFDRKNKAARERFDLFVFAREIHSRVQEELID